MTSITCWLNNGARKLRHGRAATAHAKRAFDDLDCMGSGAKILLAPFGVDPREKTNKRPHGLVEWNGSQPAVDEWFECAHLVEMPGAFEEAP
jgi:hypothetical protein